MKALVYHREQLIEIRYVGVRELNELLKALSTLPSLDVDDRGYRG